MTTGATHGERQRPSFSLRERLEARSLATPFKAKLAAVYVLITVVLILLFAYFAFDTAFMIEWLPYIAGGLPLTLFVCVGGIILATALALLGALGRLSKNPFAQGAANFYVSFVRGTPLLVQIYFIFFALPQLAFKEQTPEFLQPFLVYEIWFAGILALGINYGAYMTEIFRAGIQSVGYGQIEAAHALGMSATQTTRRVVLPQAVRIIIPPTGNEFIAMLKDSSLIALVGASELFFRAQSTGKTASRTYETLAVAALIYWGLTSIFSVFQKRLENKMERGYIRELASHGH